MDNLRAKKLNKWLEKSIENLPGREIETAELVAYVEAIVGDAEGSVRVLWSSRTAARKPFNRSLILPVVSRKHYVVALRKDLGHPPCKIS